MRHVIGLSSTAAALALCVLAHFGSSPHADTARFVDSAAGNGRAAARDERVGRFGPAWPYPPAACTSTGDAASRAPRCVRLIAVDAAPLPR
ncbi:hypothetical protein SAMN05192568_102810 [Methylobacterium pseudosasicola]|uniref:Uncharacterized protein n=1 Tax=Methylobacterium pseudosasicola TaxID=582667 RepID=A0A1I4Q521_9HYPH|nr:hypothetical protein SAMN05192568_102810 [Methylobacterium pseudosasicola]